MDRSDDTERDPPAPAGRSRIGGYRLGEMLGRGGMAGVYRGEDSDGRTVAVKIAHSTLVSTHDTRRFEREANIRLEHPNITRVFDAGIDADGTPYIVFELLEGQSVKDWMASGPMSPQQVRDLGVQACRGLAFAHAAGIVHRDLKPANLFRCSDGTIKILDFGVALWETDETRMTADGSILGTPAYIAPEQARGSGDVDQRADIWALGVVLYEALSGRIPYERSLPLAMLLSVVMDEPERLSVVSPSSPADLVLAIEGALVKERSYRWPDADSFREALEAAKLSGSRARAMSAPIAPIAPGERRVVAILLADGVGNPYAIRNAVEETGGVFIRVRGNRAIGVFGAKSWEGDEVVRAASAAMATRGAAERMAVAAGAASHASRGISGEVVGAAEQGCRAGVEGVAVESSTWQTLAEHFSLREIDGRWRELVDRTTESWASLSDERPEVELVGRRAELAQLSNAVDSVVEDQQALVVLVSGPTGIGKSRLRREIHRLLRDKVPEATVLVGRATPLSSEAELSVMSSALRWKTRDPNGRRQPIDGALSALVAGAIDDPDQARECANFLGVLLGAPSADSASLSAARNDPQLMRDRIRLSLVDLFGALAARGPLALLLEDLQWADEASMAVLEELLDRLGDTPFLLFASARPEFEDSRPDAFAGRDVIRIEPRRLGSADIAKLAQAVAGQQIRGSLVRAVSERTAGNPLFVEQIVLALRDEGRLGDDIDTLPLPTTVEAAVQSRLDHLLPDEKELCKRAALLGRAFTEPEAKALGVPNSRAVLASVKRRKLLSSRAASHGAEPEYFFRSTLISDVAYGMLTEDRRRELHRTAARHLATRSESDPEEVASHFSRGGEASVAASWYARATAAAAPRGDTGTVLRCSERALELGPPRDVIFDVLMARSDALRFLGRRDEQAAILERALEVARTPAQRARILTEKAVVLSRTGRSEQALEVAAEAVSAARTSGVDDVLAMALGWQAVAFAWVGMIAEASVTLTEASKLAASLALSVRAHAQEWRAQIAALRGDLGERRLAFGQLVELYRATGDVRRTAGAETNLADVYNRFGAYADAERALTAALEGCRRVGNRIVEGFALANLGYSLAMLGRTDEALTAIDEAAALARASGEAHLLVVARVYRCRARLFGREGLDQVAQQAERVAGDAKESLPGWALIALVVAAGARLALGDPGTALALSSRAMALRDELGGIEEDEAEVFATHARALDACGRSDEAKAARRQGCERVEQIAAGIADPELRTRFLRDVPVHRELRGC